MTAAMYRTMLYSQWKLQRAELVGFTLFAATICPFALWPHISRGAIDLRLLASLNNNSGLLVVAAMLSAVLGMMLAVRPFFLDARVKHTYALALPVPRSQYALMRILTGLTLVVLPATGFLIGALVAVQALPDTVGLRKFPVALTLRFVLATATAFATFFGIQYGLGGKARRWMLLVALTMLGAEIFGQLVLRMSLIQPTIELLSGSFSPLRVFVDHWALFDA